MTALGPNGKNITDTGDDLGRGNYKDSVPYRPSDLPPGFNELYKG